MTKKQKKMLARILVSAVMLIILQMISPEMFSGLDITFCVRGGIAANDATREDAAAVGLPFRVIDNGSNVAGTLVPRLGTEARQALEASDVILAKGMANTETLLGCGYNVYYAFLVKCPRFQKLFDKPLMTPMLVRERDATARQIVV